MNRIFILVVMFMWSCFTVSKLDKIKGKTLIYSTKNSGVRLKIYIDSTIEVEDTTLYYKLFKDILAIPVGSFEFIIAGEMISFTVQGTVWYNPKGYLFLQSEQKCSDQMYYAVRECIDCPDSVHRIRAFIVNCDYIGDMSKLGKLGKLFKKHPVEALVIDACDSVYKMSIEFSYGCEDKIQYIPKSCDSIAISVIAWRRVEVKSDIIRLSQDEKKEIIIVVDKDNAIHTRRFYVIQGAISLKRRKIFLCIFDCKRKEVMCYYLWKKSQKQ